MIIVEVFARGGAPRGPPSGAGIKTGSDDLSSRPLAASVVWNVSFPAPHPFHPSVGKRRQGTTDQLPISPSNTAPAASSQSPAAFSS
jgi:hypothetical protein